jgi:hypothetical protein
MLTKEQAITNLAKVSLDAKVAWLIYLEAGYDDKRAWVDHIRAEAKMDTMKQAYVDCEILTWDDIRNAWFYNVKVEKP